MKKFLKAACVATLLTASAGAFAVSDFTRTILTFGAQSTLSFMTVSPATSTTCLYGVLYFPTSDTAAGKAMYAAALAGYMNGKVLARVDYTVQGNGTCLVSLVQY